MALSAVRTYETVGPIERLEGLPSASTTLHKGALLVIGSSGLLSKPTDASGKVPFGVYTGSGAGSDGILVTPSSGQNRIECMRGQIWVPFSGAAQTDVGVKFYLADDGTVTKTAGSKDWYLVALAFKTGHVLLDFRHPLT